MIVQWLRNRRRAKLAKVPFPEAWEQIVSDNVHHDQFLTADQRAHLRKFVQVLVAEKYWEGCSGQRIDDEIKVTIAAQAALLTLGASPTYFDHVLSILVYPDEQTTRDVHDSGGIVTESKQMQLGEAVWQGPIILSWPDVLDGGRRTARGHNLVLHEFAHQLDMANGRLIDGIPPLQTRQQHQRWVKVMQMAHEFLVKHCNQGQGTAIDCYGAQNATEFYAVATEAFFENSKNLQRQYPDVYQLLHEYYAIDPARWS